MDRSCIPNLGRVSGRKLFLWAGPKHCGKTTAVAQLAHTARQHEFRVAGILAPSVYQDGHLTGYDVLDLHTDVRTPLAVRRDNQGDMRQFHFLEEGLRLGRRALDITDADVIIVDEFGPLELASRGWRRSVDSLVYAGIAPLVLVVRQELTEVVQEIYADIPSQCLDATNPESIHEIIRSLGRVCDDSMRIELRT